MTSLVGVAVLVLAGTFGCKSTVSSGGSGAAGGGGAGGAGGAGGGAAVGDGCNGSADCVPCSPSSAGKPCDVEGYSCVVGEGNCEYDHVCEQGKWVFEYVGTGPDGNPCP